MEDHVEECEGTCLMRFQGPAVGRKAGKRGSPVSDCQFPGLPILLLGSFQGRELQKLTPGSREALGGDGACWPRLASALNQIFMVLWGCQPQPHGQICLAIPRPSRAHHRYGDSLVPPPLREEST